MKQPETTLFMLMSVDGKISTGVSDERDFDKDLSNIKGIKESLYQYYTLEEKTDLFSFNTGRVMAKVGWNNERVDIKKLPVSFIIVDNKPHLTKRGVENLVRRTEKLYIVTTNRSHPGLQIMTTGLEVIVYENAINFIHLFETLKKKGIDKLTIQSGGEMNATLLRLGLIYNLSIVIAPILVGGRDTPTLIDGDELSSIQDLEKIRKLDLVELKRLEGSYFLANYKVRHESYQ